mgnify:CR=1 FL=1
MTANELLHYPVSQLDYQRDKASALPPHALHPGKLYNARLLLGEVARMPENIGIYAVDALVEVEHVFAERRLFAVICYVSEDGQPEGPVYTPSLTEEGIMQGSAAPIMTKEGYLLHSAGWLEDELDELVKEMLVPIGVVRTRAIPDEQPYLYR